MTHPDPRTRLLLEGPLTPTLLKLAWPNVLVMTSQAAVGLVETYFVGHLGTASLAGMALVFPVFMLMQMLSAGAIGGGIASSIARAHGRGQHGEAQSLVRHALVLAAAIGLGCTLLMLLAGRTVYGWMGGTGEALDAAMRYSDMAFGGAVFVWLFNALGASLRGAGNMGLPARVTVAGLVLLVPLSPLLIFGWGPVPALGIAGGALALLAYYAFGTLVLFAHVSAQGTATLASLVRRSFDPHLAWEILRVGLLSAVGTLCTNLSIMLATAYAGRLGVEALAGYGTAARLEYLMVPLVFGFGAPLLSIVGTCIGAGQRERALRAAWTAAALTFAVTEALGLAAAAFPGPWLGLFTQDAVAIEAGARYLTIVAPCYGFFGLGLVLYFGSQGSGRMHFAVLGSLVRVAIVAAGGWLVLRFAGGETALYLVQSAGLAAYGLTIAGSVAAGTWFRPVAARVA